MLLIKASPILHYVVTLCILFCILNIDWRIFRFCSSYFYMCCYVATIVHFNKCKQWICVSGEIELIKLCPCCKHIQKSSCCIRSRNSLEIFKVMENKCLKVAVTSYCCSMHGVSHGLVFWTVQVFLCSPVFSVTKHSWLMGMRCGLDSTSASASTTHFITCGQIRSK